MRELQLSSLLMRRRSPHARHGRLPHRRRPFDETLIHCACFRLRTNTKGYFHRRGRWPERTRHPACLPGVRWHTIGHSRSDHWERMTCSKALRRGGDTLRDHSWPTIWPDVNAKRFSVDLAIYSPLTARRSSWSRCHKNRNTAISTRSVFWTFKSACSSTCCDAGCTDPPKIWLTAPQRNLSHRKLANLFTLLACKISRLMAI